MALLVVHGASKRDYCYHTILPMDVTFALAAVQTAMKSAALTWALVKFM